jgi:signal peptidase I
MTDPTDPADAAPVEPAPKPAAPDGPARSQRPARGRTKRLALVIALALIVGVPVVLRAFIFAGFHVQSTAMWPSLLPGDRIVVRRDAYGRAHRVPARGDLVVFRHPEQPQKDDVGRVIGVPGDTLTVEDGAVFINGWRIPTCVAGVAEVQVEGKTRAGIVVVELLGDTAYLVFHDPPAHSHEPTEDTESPARDNEGPFTVADNEVFVLGDNREHSEDSRHWFEGHGRGVRVDAIKGRASSVWMSSSPSPAPSASSEGARVPSSRVGWSLTGAPSCPAGFPEATCSAVERCLANRPPRETTTPPADRSVGAAKP